MATKKKEGQPELTVTRETHPDLVNLAVEAQALHSQISELEAKEKALKAQISESFETIRTAEEAKGNYIGLLRIVSGDQATAQVQFKKTVSLAALPEEQGPVLDAYYGASRTLLYGLDVQIKNITNPLALIAEIQGRQQNPMDFLNIAIKPGLDRAFASSPNVTVEKCYQPLEGFFDVLNDIVGTLKENAKKFTSEVIKKAWSPCVKLGNK